MKLAFAYQAATASGQVVKGHLIAATRAQALLQLKRTGFRPLRLGVDPLRSLTAWHQVEISPTELGRLYTTLGRRLARGKQLSEGLEQALEYVTDERLKQAMVIMRQALVEGQDISQAMLAAGLPRRDAMMIKATSQAGRTSQAFESLGRDVKRGAALKKSVRSVFYMPAIMGAFMVLFLWGSLSFFAPITMSFLQNTGASNLGAFLQGYFAFAKLFNSNWVASSVVYFGVVLSLVALSQTSGFKRLFDRWPALRDLSEKADHAALWSGYAQLYEAAVPGPQAAQLVASAASRPDSRASFEALGSQLAAGAALDAASIAAKFPKFVIGGVVSAVSAGDLSQGLRDMVEVLEEDVALVTEKFKESVRFLSLVVMALAVVGVFMVTYYPIVASTLANA